MADFFTSSHRFSATITIGNRRLVDVLNDRLTDYLQLHNVYVSRIHKPGEIVGTVKLASLLKRNLSFIVLASDEGVLEPKYSTYGRSIEDVLITVPSFEVSGKLEIIGKFDLKAILTIGTTTFMPILGGRTVNASHPDVTFSGPIVLVNKGAVEFFSILRHG